MPDFEAASTEVAPALSTAQNEDTFVLERYESIRQDRSFYLGPNTSKDEKACIAQYYAVDELVDYLRENEQFRKITLQFPDSLVQDASIVTQLLQERLSPLKEDAKVDTRKIWVLADTAYSACCVDEVASEHVNADLVVHFGDACLNAVQVLPVVYSFGRPYLDLDQVIQKFRNTYTVKGSKICLMANAPYSYHLKYLCDQLKDEGYENLIYSMIDGSLAGDKSLILQQSTSNVGSATRLHTIGNRILLTDDNNVTIPDESALREDYALFHITIPEDPHLLYLTTQFTSVALYDPKNDAVSEGPYPSLMKRYKYMHVARTAGCIGILVNTLSLRNTKETISSLIKHIRSSGKKHYLFVVGKPNVAKLANFEPVDIWCILGCGQGGIILDQYNEFYKPIITPYELTMALNEEVTWTGKWLVDFKTVLEEIEDQSTDSETDICREKDEERNGGAPEFDAVTGKYVSTSRPLRHVPHLDVESPKLQQFQNQELINKVSGGVVIKGTVSTSAATLQNREWTGLGSDFATQVDYDEDGATVQEGISGVASGYDFDRSNRQKN